MALSSSASLCATFPVVRLRDSAACVPAFFVETGLAAGPAWLKPASAATRATVVIQREYVNWLSRTVSGSSARNISPSRNTELNREWVTRGRLQLKEHDDVLKAQVTRFAKQ